MSEPWIPELPPERNPYWDPNPPLCPGCGVTLQSLHPASRADGQWEGWCPRHGNVVPVYRDSADDDEEEEE